MVSSLDHILATRGYLSLTQFVRWLKEYHPEAAVSYPTALKLVNEKKILSVRVGDIHRIYAHEARRYVAKGNHPIGEGARPPHSTSS